MAQETCNHDNWTVGTNRNDTRRLIRCAKCGSVHVIRRKRNGKWVPDPKLTAQENRMEGAQ